ncbi:MAG: hypothetical protein AAF399_06955 [Bacteroidota bacterium]
MNSERITYLLQQFQQEALSASEEQELEQAIEQGHIEISDLPTLAELDAKLELALQTPKRSGASDRFYTALEEAQETQSKVRPLSPQPKGILLTWKHLGQMAAAIAILLLGMGIGTWNSGSEQKEAEIATLSDEIADMREIMMISQLKQSSPSERLKAVSLTREMEGDVSERVAEALLRTLNQDGNPNVRLATLEALIPYSENPTVRQGLVSSIANQESPLVQLALAELMVVLQEKNSVQGFRQIIEQEETPAEVKEELENSIKILM